MIPPKLPLKASPGFSLVEVVLALGVISFAFVALLGMMPTGLTTMRNAIDGANTARIVQSITGSVIVTEFSKLPDLDFSKSGEILYFDDEGTPTTNIDRRLYGVKLFVEDAKLPTETSTQAKRVSVVVCRTSSAAWKKFLDISTAATLETTTPSEGLSMQPVIMAKMDGIPTP